MSFPRPARWYAPQACHLPRYPAIAPLPGAKLHVVHCASSNQKLVTSSVTTTRHRKGPQHQSDTATPSPSAIATAMASSSDVLPPEFLQRAQQGGIVVTGRPNFPRVAGSSHLVLAVGAFSTSCLPPSPSLLTRPFAEIPKLDLESYIQNYRGTWSPPAALCLYPPLIRSQRPNQTRQTAHHRPNVNRP